MLRIFRKRSDDPFVFKEHLKKDGYDIRDEYSLKLSHTMRICRYITLSSLVVFVTVMVCFYSESINYENASRLLSSLKIDLKEPVMYSGKDMSLDSNDIFGHFRSKPVAYSDGKLIFFGKNGSISSAFSVNEKLNQVLFCNTFILAVKENKIEAYDSSSMINEMIFSDTVYSVDLCKNGTFTVVTHESGYRSAVYVCDKKFNTLYKWLSADKTVLKAQISDNNILTLWTVSSEGGNYGTRIIRIDTASDTVIHTQIFDSDILSLNVFSDGSYSVCEENEITFFSSDNIPHQTQINGSVKTVTSSNGCLCYISDGYVNVTDSGGSELLKKEISSAYRKLYIYGSTVYLLYSDRIEQLTDSSYTVYSVQSPLALMQLDNKSLSVFTSDGVRALSGCEIINIQNKR